MVHALSVMDILPEKSIEMETEMIMDALGQYQGDHLMLTKQEVYQLCEKRNTVLDQCERLEMNGGIIGLLIREFMDCSYISQNEFADVMSDLIEVFYTMKNECDDLLDDLHLVQKMRTLLDESHGVMQEMTDAILEYCRSVVAESVHGK